MSYVPAGLNCHNHTSSLLMPLALIPTISFGTGLSILNPVDDIAPWRKCTKNPEFAEPAP